MEKTTNTQTKKRTHRRSPMATIGRLLGMIAYEDDKRRHLPHLRPAPKAHKLWRRKTQRYKVNDRSGRKQS